MQGEPEWGICLTVTCKFSPWILLEINPIILFMLSFLCPFFLKNKTNYWR